MRRFENQVQKVKYEVLREVARFAYEGTLDKKKEFIPLIIDPGPKPRARCCIYHEREITKERIQLALGGNKEKENVIEVLATACDECPINRYVITETCRGCIAHRCESVCPRDALFFDGQKALIDYSKCIECGKCKDACPYNAISDVLRPCRRECPTNAITIDAEKMAVIDHKKCVNCGLCVFNCPFGAIQDKSMITEVIEVLKTAPNEGIKPYAVLAPAFASQFTYVKLGQVIKAIKELGFVDVVEAALGADIVAKHETQEFADHIEHAPFMTSSCCPSFAKLVEIKHPELIGNMSTSISPMIATSQLIKQMDPKAVVVFIGPCIAKKQEAQEPDLKGITDYVLTFEELAAMIDGRGIDMESLEEAPLNNASYYGRIFARSGGLSDAIGHIIEQEGLEVDYRPVLCDGITDCDKQLKLGKVNRQSGNFLEGMACKGGCVNGPVSLNHGPKDKIAVNNYGKLALEQDVASSLRILNIDDLKMKIHRQREVQTQTVKTEVK